MGWLGALAEITAAHFNFSHCQTATFQSGAAPCAMMLRPSGEKEREEYSYRVFGKKRGSGLSMGC